MRAVVIQVPDGDEPEDIADIVAHVATQLDQGFTSGRVGVTSLNWSIETTED